MNDNKPQKKMVIFCILDILKRYTDFDHRLQQKEIEERLLTDYNIKVDRKSVKSNIGCLKDFGYDIECDESSRRVLNKKTGEFEESIVTSGYYLAKDFDDSELRLLIDSILFAPNISASQSKQLIKKLQAQSSDYFKPRVKHIASMSSNKSSNKQLFYTIDIVDEAITTNCKIQFKYGEYGTDLKFHPRKTEDGSDRIYVVSPYQMAVREDKYYLICNNDKFDNVVNYRMDRILDVKILDESVRPFKTLLDSNGHSFNLQEYMNEHIFMYSGSSTRAKLRIVREMVTDIIDIFGKDVKFSNETDTHVEVVLKANEMSIMQFAQRYSHDVVILEPEDLRVMMLLRLQQAFKGYDILVMPPVGDEPGQTRSLKERHNEN